MDDGGDEGGFCEAAEGFPGEEEAGEAWLEGEGGHFSAGGGEGVLGVGGVELAEEGFGFLEGGF